MSMEGDMRSSFCVMRPASRLRFWVSRACASRFQQTEVDGITLNEEVVGALYLESIGTRVLSIQVELGEHFVALL